ncbi:MAG: hypothetical protein ACTSP9_06680 [Promethearchaeota archaeon]
MTQIEIKKGMNEEEIELFVGQVLKELSLKEKVHLMSGNGCLSELFLEVV